MGDRDLEVLKDDIKYFVEEHNIKNLEVNIEEKEYDENRPKGKNTYKEVTIIIEY